MSLKIQFPEGAGRKALFEKYPPEYVYVFRKRVPAWNNGMERNPATGRRWASTMTFCWYVWRKGRRRNGPAIRWIE